MIFSIGAYRIGNEPIRLVRTSKLAKMVERAANEQKLSLGTQTKIQRDVAVNFLNIFGGKAKEAIKLLPESGDVGYFAAHRSLQLSNEKKMIFSVVEQIRKPIRTFLVERLALVLKK